jgi:hypothetical protein
MIRKIVLWLLPPVLLVTVSSVAAQQTKKVPRIGYLETGLPHLRKKLSRHFNRGCATSVISRARTSPSSTVLLRA